MTHIQQRRDTFATWSLVNPVLMEGEAGHETNTGRWKLGDGVTAYNDLPYKAGVDSVAGKTGAVTLVVADVAGAAPLASPTFTGTPTAPTPNVADNTKKLATTEWVKNQAYAAKDSPSFLGNPTAPTPATADNDTTLATTAFVKSAITAAALAPLADAALTGNPTAPTPVSTDNDTSIATTAFVKAARLKHTGAGTRLDATGSSQPSQPETLQILTGRAAGNTNGLGVLTITFPGTGLPNGVLFLSVTTLAGAGINPVVDSGAVTKTTATMAWPGVPNTSITFAYMIVGY